MAADTLERSSAPPWSFGQVALHGFLILGSVVMTLPFVWMLSTSLKTPGEVFAYPPSFIPSPVAWDNYGRVVSVMPFGRFYLNSIIVTVSVVAIQMLVASLAAFAFARLRFAGRRALFLLYLATLMVPFEVTLVPNFILVRSFGWYDTYAGLIVPRAFAATAFSTFLLRQYFLGIPRDLDEAARLDGATSLRIWWNVVMPIAAPALAALTTFVSLNTWNDFLWPLVITDSEEVRTLQVGLSTLQGQYSVQWNILMAGSVIAMLPILIVYLFGQRWFIQGITLTGMGGR